MKMEKKFKEIIAQYCELSPEEMKNSLRFREDLGFSSLDFMSMLGEIEDEFDVEFEEDKLVNIHTISEALGVISDMKEAV